MSMDPTNKAPATHLSQEALPVFFKELVEHAMQEHKVVLTTVTTSYLVNLLNDFTRSEDFFLRESQTLASLYLEATQNLAFAQRVHLFRRVGDIALYTSGFFSDSLNRKLVDIDYYIAMGGNAYLSLTGLMRDALFKELYSELAHKFSSLVALLTFISEQRQLTSNKDILRTYEKWLRTGDPHLHEKLKELGLQPAVVTSPNDTKN